MDNSILQGALIGAGDISEYHLRAWAMIPQVQIVAVADPNLAAASQRAALAGLSVKHAYPDLASLLDAKPELDFLDITAPPEVRLELVVQAAARGLHVICQKPFAPSLDIARQMMQLCQQAGVTLAVHENWRWRAWYHTIKGMLDGGVIGKPLYARVFGHTDSWVPGRFRAEHRYADGDKVALYDYGVHHIDLMRFLFGEPISVFARLGRANQQMRADDRAVVMLNYPQMIALSDISFSSYAPQGFPRRQGHPIEDFRLEGDAGTIQTLINAAGKDVIRLTDDQGVHEQPAYCGDSSAAYLASFHTAQAHFVDCLLRGVAPDTAATDNYHTLAVMLAAYHSGETGQVVDIALFKESN